MTPKEEVAASIESISASLDRLTGLVEQAQAAALDAVTAIGDAKDEQRRVDAKLVRELARGYHSEQCAGEIEALERAADAILKGGK